MLRSDEYAPLLRSRANFHRFLTPLGGCQMDETGHAEEFIRELTGSQDALFAFIFSLLPQENSARDVLQETNLVLWRKAGEFRPGSRFIAWAFQVARFEVLAYYKKAGRDRHVFDTALLTTIADEAEQRAGDFGLSIQAFEHCVKKLTDHQRDLFAERYAPGGTVKAMAEKRRQTPAALSVTLSRIRRTVRECIARRLAQGERS